MSRIPSRDSSRRREREIPPLTSPTSEDSEDPLSDRAENIPKWPELGEEAPDPPGDLGALEVEVTYQESEQLVLRVVSARHIPRRYLTAGSKLYVKARDITLDKIWKLGRLLS